MRKDYDDIKKKTEKFLELWKNGKTQGLENIIIPDAICNLGTVKEYSDGSQHSRYGIINFIIDTPEHDVFHLHMYNYVCRLKENRAQQSFVGIGRVIKYTDADTVKVFEFSAFFNNSWIKEDDDWKIAELRMDIVDYHGDFKEFLECWYFEDPKAKWHPGIHLPVIQGELDSPWVKIPEAEELLSEEEKCLEQFLRYAYGVDTMAFSHVNDAMAEDIIINLAPWGTMDKRAFMTDVKYHRQQSRVWTHTVKVEDMKINGDVCELSMYRMAGHRQRTHNVEFTKDNINNEYACARYEVVLKKRQGIWKMTKMYYYLGVIDLGEFED